MSSLNLILLSIDLKVVSTSFKEKCRSGNSGQIFSHHLFHANANKPPLIIERFCYKSWKTGESRITAIRPMININRTLQSLKKYVHFMQVCICSYTDFMLLLDANLFWFKSHSHLWLQMLQVQTKIEWKVTELDMNAEDTK